jgi:S1-C subfamily serine protease
MHLRIGFNGRTPTFSTSSATSQLQFEVLYTWDFSHVWVLNYAAHAGYECTHFDLTYWQRSPRECRRQMGKFFMASVDTDEKPIPALIPGLRMEKPNGIHPPVDETAKRLYLETLPSAVRVGTEKSIGSGFYIDDKGTIATDAHVVLNSKEHYSIDNDGKIRRLRLDRIDDLHDLAILKPVTPNETKPLTLGSSDVLKTHDPIYAIGNPKGVSRVYVSPGEVIGYSTPLDTIRRTDPKEAADMAWKLLALNDPDYDEFYTRKMIAANIHVEHGNSGGPVLDRDGKVIGLTDMGSPALGRAYMTPVEDLHRLQTSPLKYRIDYEYQPASWAHSYIGLWQNHPVSATAATGLTAAAGGIGLAAMRRYSIAGGGLAMMGGAVKLVDDYSLFSQYQDDRDTLKYGLAMAADTTTTLGGLAMLAMRRKTYGLSAVAIGIGGRLATEFIPNRLVNTSIERLDGTQKPLMGTKEAESVFDQEAFGIK